MRTCKLEIVELDGDSRKLLYALASQMREAYNFVWRRWEAWHTAHDTSSKLRECLAADRAWREADTKTRGRRPKWNVQPWPNELAKELYHALARRCPGLNSRVLVLLLQRIRQVVTTKQSSAAATKWWIAILLDLDGRGSSRHPQPIPFDAANAKLLPADEKGRVWLEVRLDRIQRAGGKRGTSTVIRAALKTGGKRAHYARPAVQMAAGSRKMSGAQVIYDGTKKKWFAALTYEPDAPEAVLLDPGRTAILRPGRKSCWLLRLDGRTQRLGGRGHHVRHVRRSLLMQRWSRQHSYTYSPKRKGRGKDRALVPLFKLSNRWLNFTKSCNQQLVADVAERLLEHCAGKVVLVQQVRGETVLATSGKIEGRNDSTSWPWYQVQQLLQQKCQRHNIEVVLRESFSGASRRQAEQRQVVAI